MAVSAKADVNYNLLNEWSLQPAAVQYSLARQSVTIDVVPVLDYNATELNETWAYTRVTTLADQRTITSCSIKLLQGHEDALTHEVGHALSNYNGYRYFWTDNSYWDMIYNAEGSRCLYYQGTFNKYEYFASCYEEYIRFNGYMKVRQPCSYNYIKVVLSY